MRQVYRNGGASNHEQSPLNRWPVRTAGPPILARIEKLESGMAALEKLGSATQVRVERIDDALARLEPAVREIAVENRKQFADLLNRINGVEVRLASID